MAARLDDVLAAVRELGYDAITRDDGYESASGPVPLPAEYVREKRNGWRRFLPRVYCGDDSDLVPDDLREAVEDRGWTVQPMGRDPDTVTVVISEGGV